VFNYRKHKPPLLLLLIAALVGLLAILAALQYRWLGQLSEHERERMETALRAGALRFSEDFDRAITQAFLSLQMDAPTLRSQAWGSYAERYTQWVSATPYPTLVSDVFIVDLDEQGQLRLSRFNQGRRRFEPTSWPDKLEAVNQHLIKGRAIFPGTTFPFPEKSELIVEEIPALMIPITSAPSPDSRETIQGHSAHVTIVGYTVIVLDLACMTQELMPALARHYFSSAAAAGKLDYDLKIVSRRNPSKVIYQSSSSPFSEQVASRDAVVNLFSLQFEKLVGLMSAQIPSEQFPATNKSGTRGVSILTEDHQTAGSLPPKVSPSGEDSALWQLMLKHRTGSLEAAVANLRRRNLLISFGVLLLLACSLVMIAFLIRRAQQLARQQMEFVAGVSHDLRTPVAILCSASENLADGLVRGHQQVVQYGEILKGESYQLAETVEQVLEFAGTQSLRTAFTLHRIGVADIVENALITYQRQLEEKGFKIETEIEPDLPSVMADVKALKRAIQNLLNNAMKYGEGRRIELRARKAVNRKVTEVRITVMDQGPGIESMDLPYIFEPFRRGRAAVAAQIHGNGLGLNVVQRIMDAHGGRVSVRNYPGRGSAFTLHLPAAPNGF